MELVVVDQTNKPPVWEQQTYGPIYVKENAPQGEIVTTVRARFVPPSPLPKAWDPSLHKGCAPAKKSGTNLGVWLLDLVVQVPLLRCTALVIQTLPFLS